MCYYLHIGQKTKILENHPDFLTFSANTLDHFQNRQILSYRKTEYLKTILRIEASKVKLSEASRLRYIASVDVFNGQPLMALGCLQ